MSLFDLQLKWNEHFIFVYLLWYITFWFRIWVSEKDDKQPGFQPRF